MIMETAWIIGKVLLLIQAAIIAGLPLSALPATLSLAAGRRPGLKELTLEEEAMQLSATGETGWDLVKAARALTAECIQYCRRKSFDSPATAFQRGYGYCVQQAHTLTEPLARLGIEAKVVQAFRNRFPDGTVGGHAWVRVKVDVQERDIDLPFYDVEMEALTFASLTKVTNHTPLFKLVTQWGKAVVNAHRYYRTGKDM